MYTVSFIQKVYTLHPTRIGSHIQLQLKHNLIQILILFNFKG